MRLRRSFALVAVLGFVAGGLALAEDLDVPSLFDSAKKSFAEKHYGKSLADVKLIAGEIGRLRGAQVRTTLPPAPAGWTMEESDDEGGAGMFGVFGGGLNVSRRYAKGDETRVKVEMLADSPLIASFAMLMTNPAFLQKNQRVITLKGRKAILEADEGDKRASLKILLNENTTLLTVEGEGVAKTDVTDTFGNALDLDAMEKALKD